MTYTLAQAAGLFTAPVLAGIGAAAVAIPIIIHLMSRFRRKPESWGAMRFLIEAYQKQRKRLQLEKLLLLLVRCMVVLLAGLALAGPVLTGCSRDGFSLTGSAGRVVYLVIDDGLSSQTREAGSTRLEQHKQAALDVIDEMGPGDRAVVIRMARPVAAELDAPTADTAQLKQTIETIEPRFSRGELIASLAQVQQSMDAVGTNDAVIVLLSDFPTTSAYFEQALPPELEGLGDRATIVTAQPPEGTDNVQVLSLGLRRQMVVAESTGSTVVGGQAVLRRFGAIGQARTVQLKVSVLTPGDQVLAETTRDVRFGSGAREQSANFDLPVQLPGEALIGSGRELIVKAELVADASDAGLDVLPADDLAVAVVRLRDRLQVAMIDNEQDTNPNPGELEAWQWVRAALTPRGPGAVGSFELSTMLPTAVNEEAIESYDAAVVLRPDQLTLRGWETLEQFAQQGGLVWVFTPALETEPDWAQTMQRTFDLPWTIGDALVRYEPSEGSTKQSAEVDETIAPPDALQFLAADWREKLGWWSLQSWLPLSTEDEDRWVALKTDDAALPEQDKPVVLAQRGIGDGSLVFSAVPLDTRFTNLPIRALFVPLMHDTLRGVLGNQAGQLPLIAGDEPALNRTWRGIGELNLIDEDNPAKLLVQSDGDDVALLGAAEQPGVYLGTVGGSPRLLAVNPDADAGDTIGGQGPLELLLDKLGGWSYLSERQQAGGVLAKTALGRDLTMLLLWVLLALVLFETFLARWFSHATDHSTPTVIGRALGALRGSETAKPVAAAGGDA
ncbi:MAG: BatA domain-containing protein [Planctomycetota bacterium]